MSTPSRAAHAPCPGVVELCSAIQPVYLRAVVDAVAIPRHYTAEAENNRRVRDWIEREFRSCGYEVRRSGAFDNLVAVRSGRARSKPILVGAHYDSVPGCPGADDNASAVAAMLGVARVVAETPCADQLIFVAFNREEDRLLGSRDFVEHYLNGEPDGIEEAHILEMVGYCDPNPGSQSAPRGLPITVPDVGDFLGIVSNRDSNHLAAGILAAATTYVPELPVMNLQTYFGMERYIPDLERSDHAPFWDRRMPAVIWTDTSEYRNPHYHLSSDSPDTLNYTYLTRVARVLVATLLERS